MINYKILILGHLCCRLISFYGLKQVINFFLKYKDVKLSAVCSSECLKLRLLLFYFIYF